MAYLTSHPASRRPAFSLAEMMIAIVILGLGLLMAATMFPIGWTKARKLAEFANQTAITEAANTTTNLLTRVSDPSGANSSYLGDFGNGDPFVHALHFQNVLADTLPGDVISFRGDYMDSQQPSIRIAELVTGNQHPSVQIDLQERIFPPLPRRPMPLDNPPPTQAEMDQWDARLADRRFAWTLLHKLTTVPVTASETRVFTMYYVTLRRRDGQRFARQDPNALNPTTQPEALFNPEDVRFPVPWLVNLKVLGNWLPDGTPRAETGVPSEAEANPDDSFTPDARLIAQMLMTGSSLIDRLTGHLYTVKQHRFTGSGDSYDYQAAMTLDREINVEDVDDGSGLVGLPDNDTVELGSEDLRDFWVFPPAVLKDRPAGQPGFPIFDGTQPVVAIITRTVAISP